MHQGDLIGRFGPVKLRYPLKGCSWERLCRMAVFMIEIDGRALIDKGSGID